MECYIKNVNNFYLLTIFANQSILYVWQSSECASGLLKLFWCGSKRDTQEHLIYVEVIMVFILNFAFSPYSDSYKKSNIQANGSLTKIKEKWSTVQFDVFDLSIIFSVPMSQQTSVVDESGVCYFLHPSN